jgi:hypothetical protein
MFDESIKQASGDCGTINAGSRFNEAIVVNSHQNNLHYTLTPKYSDVTLLYVSKAKILAALEKVN